MNWLIKKFWQNWSWRFRKTSTKRLLSREQNPPDRENSFKMKTLMCWCISQRQFLKKGISFIHVFEKFDSSSNYWYVFRCEKKNSQRDQNLNKKSEFSNEKCFFFCGLYKIINKYILPINYVLNKHMVVFFTSILKFCKFRLSHQESNKWLLIWEMNLILSIYRYKSCIGKQTLALV